MPMYRLSCRMKIGMGGNWELLDGKNGKAIYTVSQKNVTLFIFVIA